MGAEQQKPSENELRAIPQILSFFKLGQMADAAFLESGAANHNYIVTTQDHTAYVVKFPIEETRESLENDLAIQKQLQEAGIGSSAYCHIADGTFIFDQKITAVVSPKIDGIHPQDLDEEVSFAIGNMLARFHKAATTLPHPHQGWLSPMRTALSTKYEDDPLIQQARKFIAEGKHIYENSLPRGIIHGDLYEENLLVNSNDPTKVTAIFDFEEAEENLFIVDIARTMVSVCVADAGTKLDPQLMDAFQRGYSSVRPLTKEERANLQDAMKYTAGACMLWQVKNGFQDYAAKMITRVQSLQNMF